MKVSINRFVAVSIVPGVRRPDGEQIKFRFQYSRVGPDDDTLIWPPEALEPMLLKKKQYGTILHPDGRITVNQLFTVVSERGIWQGALRHGNFHMKLKRAFVDQPLITYLPTFDD